VFSIQRLYAGRSVTRFKYIKHFPVYEALALQPSNSASASSMLHPPDVSITPEAMIRNHDFSTGTTGVRCLYRPGIAGISRSHPEITLHRIVRNR